jgi:hypothetical protein
METPLEMIRAITKNIRMECLGNSSFYLRIERDVMKSENGRIFIQVCYKAPCTKKGIEEEYKGRKWYLSDYMTEDEVIKTAYTAFKMAVEHEIMEGFKVEGIILFNPHVNFRSLLEASQDEVKRDYNAKIEETETLLHSRES